MQEHEFATSAHVLWFGQVVPTGGYGMNSGVGDAMELGWKLAARLSGWGGEHMLASYEIERRHVMVRNRNESERHSTQYLRWYQALSDGLLDADSAEAGAHREQLRRLIEAEGARGENESDGIELGYRFNIDDHDNEHSGGGGGGGSGGGSLPKPRSNYMPDIGGGAPLVRSPLVVPDGSPEPPWERLHYTPSSWPGGRPPVVWLPPPSPFVTTFDALDSRGFTLLRFDPAAAAGHLLAAARERGVPLALVDVSDAHAARLYERKLVLVRPDIVVAWRADAQPASLEEAGAVVDWVRGSGAQAAAAVGSYGKLRRGQRSAGGDGGEGARDDFAKGAVARQKGGRENTGEGEEMSGFGAATRRDAGAGAAAVGGKSKL